MITKDYILNLSLISLGKEITTNPQSNKGLSILDFIYEVNKKSAIIDIRPHFAVKNIQLQKQSTDRDYLLPKDFLLLQSYNIYGNIVNGNIYRISGNSINPVVITYYSNVDEGLFNSDFAKYLSIKLAIESAAAFEKTANDMLLLEKSLGSLYTKIKSSQASNIPHISHF